MGAEAGVGLGPISAGRLGTFACLDDSFDDSLEASIRLRRARRAAFSFSRALKRAEICSSIAANAGHDPAEAISPIHNTTASFVNPFIVPPLPGSVQSTDSQIPGMANLDNEIATRTSGMCDSRPSRNA